MLESKFSNNPKIMFYYDLFDNRFNFFGKMVTIGKIGSA